jgi:dolichyl-phosphate-mannose--protein O-mannosyl transferase
MLGEIGLFAPDGRRLPPPARAAGLEALFDEPGAVPFRPSARTGMYFDETYFARSGWEMLLGLPASERTHPPLGKLLIAGGMLLFGVTPLGWRFAGALAGALAVPLLYLLARRLLKRPESALAAALLFLLDFMRFVQARLATVDVFVLLFSLLAFYWAHGFWTLDLFRPSEGRTAIPRLLAAGAAVGAAASCKWSGAYVALGVALLWAASAWRHAALCRAARRSPRRGRPAREIVGRFPGVALRLLFGGLAGLVVIPAAVYLASYLPGMLRHGATLADIAARQAQMFHYHTLITETRWYASPWWEWPVLVRPIWLYRGLVGVPAGSVSSIVTMGNPLVWWGGGLALLAAAASSVRRPARSGGAVMFILVGFLSQYLPWAFAPRRLTFIYHYLPCVPFLALAAGYVFDRWLERAAAGKDPRGARSLLHARLALWAFVALAALLFAFYYPLLTGLVVPRSYAGALRLLKTWIFFQ